MPYQRSRLGTVIVLMVSIMALGGAQISPAPAVWAQEGGQCEQVADQALVVARAACSDMLPGEACYAHAGVSAEGNQRCARYDECGGRQCSAS